MEKSKIMMIIGFLLLLIAIPATLYLVKQQQTLKSRASFIDIVEFLNSSGQVITETSTPNIRLRITHQFVTPTPTPTLPPITTSTDDKRIFVTSTVYNGNLGGLSGADQKCQDRATVANLGGTWKAWLSDATTSAFSRVIHTSGSYKLKDGTVVAGGWNQLIGGTLSHEINMNELGSINNPAHEPQVFTATKVDGSNYTDQSSSCQNWTSFSESVNFIAGYPTMTDSLWTDWVSLPCSNNGHLYCFEQ